jgi:AcrR family transcriptional regulator
LIPAEHLEAVAEKKNSRESAARGHGVRRRGGWQAAKTESRRQLILDAALDCFVTLGYARTTSDRIAQRAGVSRGAMVHHFPTKQGLIQAAIDHLCARRIESFRAAISAIGTAEDRAERGLDAYWSHLTGPLFAAFQELVVAARTDPDLAAVLRPATARFDEAWYRTACEIFPEWQADRRLFDLAMDLTQFLLEGMALNPLTHHAEERVQRVLRYHKDRLREILAAAAGTATPSAIDRFRERPADRSPDAAQQETG